MHFLKSYQRNELSARQTLYILDNELQEDHLDADEMTKLKLHKDVTNSTRSPQMIRSGFSHEFISLLSFWCDGVDKNCVNCLNFNK